MIALVPVMTSCTSTPAIAGVLVQDVITGTNAIICAHLFLNFVAGYALAWRVTRDWPAAMLGALLTGWSPYVTEHLPGHFNLIAVWVFPLTASLTLTTFDGSRRGAFLLGLALAAIAWIEYYYAVYAIVLVAVLLVAHVCRTTWLPAPRWLARVHGVLSVPVAIALLVAIVVAVTGGTMVQVAGSRISLRSAGNPIAAAWLLMLVAAGLTIAARARLQVNRRSLTVHVTHLALAAATLALCTLPLLVSVTRVWLRGDYVSQRYLWRSAPRGIDLATLVAGNPHGLLFGGAPLRAYARFGVDHMEQTAWMPLAAVALCVAALMLRRRDPVVRLWAIVGLAFLIWALGPYVAAFGEALPLPLPAILVRYVPIVSNARVPARAIVVVYLAVAMLAAAGFATLRQRRAGWAVALALLVLLDVLPARTPLHAIERPAIYEILRQRPEPGAICELPFGLRDSFGITGALDPLAIWHQTLHERAMTGGFVSRLPPRVTTGYLSSPLFGPLLRLSAGGAGDPLPSRADALAALNAAGIRFVVVDRAAAPPALLAFVRGLGLTSVAEDERREVLLVPR